MTTIILIVLVFTCIGVAMFYQGRDKKFVRYCALGSAAAVSILILISSLITVPAGHIKVATLFGEVQDDSYGEGLHLVNPFYDFVPLDLRQKTYKETAGVPSEDKLITSFDVSIQYRLMGSFAPFIIRNTGDADSMINVHLVPKLRSLLREQGKGIPQAQDFFKENIQARLQSSLQLALSEYMSQQGMQVQAVLIRDVVLPKVIRDSIDETKEREQQILKQQAELLRFETEQEQKVKTANAEFEAAKLEAQKIRELADAEAYKIEAINNTLAKSPNYIELKKVEQWNGVLPVYTGGENIPMIDIRK